MFLRRLRHPVAIAAIVLLSAHGALFTIHKKITAVGNYVRAHNIYTGERSDARPHYAAEFDADSCLQPVVTGTSQIHAAAKERIVFDYYTAATAVSNDGSTIRVQMKHGSTLDVGGTPYQLEQIHFHRLTDHSGDLVAHLIHRADDGRQVVLAVLLRQGHTNPALAKLWRYLPPKAGERNSLWDVRVDPNDLLPADHTYYRYGSACGNTQWLALVTPTELSPHQLAAYDHLYHNRQQASTGGQLLVAAADRAR